MLKSKKGKTCLTPSGNPFENVPHSFPVTELVFTEYLECAKHLLNLTDGGGKLGKSVLLKGLVWVFYTKCWIF